ncbi:MAG: rRNA pseudouridine synthase [Chlorobi bacterium]|nr:rRNA pseudouridine synthase [Chlorobiota bacterium]
MEQLRLNKYLASAGIASRRKSEEFILQGRVSVNGKVVTELGRKIDPSKDTVSVDGETLKKEANVYFMLYKPRGVITSTKDDKNRRTVVELINTDRSIFPVGRLDYNTTGLLFLTNDGDFANILTHPSNKIEREYLATLDKPLTKEDRERLLKGIILERKRSRFQKIEFPEPKNFKKVKVTTIEGRNHFVKNMFDSLGYFVKKLKRESFGGMTLGILNPGEYRMLTDAEINKLIKKKKSK